MSSLLTEFLSGQRNYGIGCFPFGSALIEFCRQVVKHFCVYSIQRNIQLLSFQMLEETPPGVRHVLDDYRPFLTFPY
jgi:hypothetical protein